MILTRWYQWDHRPNRIDQISRINKGQGQDLESRRAGRAAHYNKSVSSKTEPFLITFLYKVRCWKPNCITNLVSKHFFIKIYLSRYVFLWKAASWFQFDDSNGITEQIESIKSVASTKGKASTRRADAQAEQRKQIQFVKRTFIKLVPTTDL